MPNSYITFCNAYRSSVEWKECGYHRLSVPEQGKLLGAKYRSAKDGEKSVVKRGTVNDELLIAHQSRDK